MGLIKEQPIQQETIIVNKINKNNTNKNICYKDLSEYITSPYCFTEYCAKPHNDKDPCCDICMSCVFCIPKQILFFPCLIGSILNGCINYCKKTDKNYLC